MNRLGGLFTKNTGHETPSSENKISRSERWVKFSLMTVIFGKPLRPWYICKNNTEYLSIRTKNIYVQIM